MARLGRPEETWSRHDRCHYQPPRMQFPRRVLTKRRLNPDDKGREYRNRNSGCFSRNLGDMLLTSCSAKGIHNLRHNLETRNQQPTLLVKLGDLTKRQMLGKSIYSFLIIAERETPRTLPKFVERHFKSHVR